MCVLGPNPYGAAERSNNYCKINFRLELTSTIVNLKILASGINSKI
jgi:hypothetical protein